MSTTQKFRVSFLGDWPDDVKEGGSPAHSVCSVPRETGNRNDRRSPSFIVRRKWPMRSFHDRQAEKIRKELLEEERKWEKFLDEPAEPKEIMKYMARPVPKELTGSKIARGTLRWGQSTLVITGAAKMADLDKQVEKMIKEKHKQLAVSAENETIPEEELTTNTPDHGDPEEDDDTLHSRQIFEVVDEVEECSQLPVRAGDEDTDSSGEGKEDINELSSSPSPARKKKVTREDKENMEEEIRLQKLLDSISKDDNPIYKMMRFVFPESPNIPEDPNDPYWYLKNKDYVRHVMKTLGKTGFDDSMGVTYRKEFDANRLAAIEHYWHHVVPRQYGHVYYTPKELRRAEKIQNLKLDLNSQLLPEKFVDFKELKIKTFVPPTREMDENDILYDIRMATHLKKFKDSALKDFMNRPADSVRLDSGVWATVDCAGRPDEADECSTSFKK